MSLKLKDILLYGINEFQLSVDERLLLLKECSRAVNLLSLVEERIRAIEVKLRSDDNNISNIELRTIDKPILSQICILLDLIKNEDEIIIEKRLSQDETIVVKEPLMMKTILKLIDSLYNPYPSNNSTFLNKQ